MQIAATLKGADAVIRRFRQISERRRAEVKRAVAKTAYAVQAHAVRSIQRGPASGEMYRATKGGRMRQASAPGEPPMSDTGNLAAWIRVVLADTGMEARVGIGERARYGLFLEFGTQAMKPRPWLRPALSANRVPYRISIEETQRGKD